MKYVNLGCGSRYHEDWVNIDVVSRGRGVIAHDITKGLLFDDSSVDVVYHSHVLEHIRRADAGSFIKECLRVLRPGGVVRIAMPDLEELCRLYLETVKSAAAGDARATDRYEWVMLELLDQTVRERSGGEMLDYLKRQPLPDEPFVIRRIGEEGRELLREVRKGRSRGVRFPPILKRLRRGLLDMVLGKGASRALEIGRFRLAGEVHQWLYDRHSLSQLLQSSGFDAVRLCEASESQIPNWDRFHLDTLDDGTPIKPDSFYMEAVCPASQAGR